MLRPPLLLVLVLPIACGDDPRLESPPPRRKVTPPVSTRTTAPGLPAPNARDQLLRAHHLRWVSGDIDGARKVLLAVASEHSNRRELRARASLRLAEIAEITGDRRRALDHLDSAKAVAGPGHGLALEADDRRARILTDTPLADVRGPVPGSVVLKLEPPMVLVRFRRAENLLASYHRIVVAPRLENINEVLRTKQRALARAIRAYQKVAATGGKEARAAALFRMGAMYHHLAEAVAFEIPPELVPSEAGRLRRKLRAESTASLRKALSYYREAAKVEQAPGGGSWPTLAEREVKTLSMVLRSSSRKKR
jgi:hypothetical protein